MQAIVYDRDPESFLASLKEEWQEVLYLDLADAPINLVFLDSVGALRGYRLSLLGMEGPQEVWDADEVFVGLCPEGPCTACTGGFVVE